MTRRLYYDDAYTESFSSGVIEAWQGEDGDARVVLAETLFYPTSGGQMHDLGTLGGRPVLNVVDEGDRVVHVLSRGDLPAPGDLLEGRIDARRRADHRQQHSGQHVLSRVLENRLGLATISSRLGETGNTLDIGVDDLDWDVLDRIEDETNQILWDGRAVRVRYVGPDEVAALDLAKVPDRAGPLRVIEVEGIDTCACGGTHVTNTAEIGLVAITRKERFRGGLRLHFLCGRRAVAFRRERSALVRRLSATLTTGDDQLEDLATRNADELRMAQKEIASQRRDLLLAQARDWVASARPVDVRGRPARLVLQTLPPHAATVAGEVASALAAESDLVAVLLVPEGDRTQLVIARGRDLDLDCQGVLRAVLDGLGGRGGGRPEHARGSFPGDSSASVEARLLDQLPG